MYGKEDNSFDFPWYSINGFMDFENLKVKLGQFFIKILQNSPLLKNESFSLNNNKTLQR